MVLGIYGAGGLGVEYCVLATAVNERAQRWNRIVFVDDTLEKDGTTLIDLPVMSFSRAVEAFGKDGIEFIIALGEPAHKEALFRKLIGADCEVTSLIHPDVKLAPEFAYGKGVVIHGDNSTPPCSSYGNNVLIQGNTVTGHNVNLGDNVTISSLVFVGGNVTVGKNTYIGPSSCIRNGLTIGENVIIGMGAVVTKDVPDNAVVYGNPAKIMRYNESGRVFSK